jgi:hypothetical protein
MLFSRINAYAQRDLMVYFKPVDKKMGSVIRIHIMIVIVSDRI